MLLSALLYTTIIPLVSSGGILKAWFWDSKWNLGELQVMYLEFFSLNQSTVFCRYKRVLYLSIFLGFFLICKFWNREIGWCNLTADVWLVCINTLSKHCFYSKLLTLPWIVTNCHRVANILTVQLLASRTRHLDGKHWMWIDN